MAVDSWFQGFLREGPLANLVTYSGGQLIAPDGTPISTASNPHIYPLGGQPYPWLVPSGTEILIDPASCLSGVGITNIPIKLVADSTGVPGTSVWRPQGEQVLYSSFGSYAIPVATVSPGGANVEQTFFPSNTRPVIPYMFLYLGIGIRIQFLAQKDADAAVLASTFRCRLGTQNVVNSNSIVTQVFTGAAVSQEATLDRIIRVTKLGSIGIGQFTTASAAKLFTPASLSGDNNAGDYTANFSTAQDLYVFLNHVVNNTTSGAYLINFQISLVP